MTQQTDRQKNKLLVNKKRYRTKTLPKTFSTKDVFGLPVYMCVSVLFHVFLVSAMFLMVFVFGITNPLVNKPEWKTKDIEFVLTTNEKEPINKNTRYRSDKNSQAGGISDPNRPVSMPSPAPSVKSAVTPNIQSAPPKPKMQQAQPKKAVQNEIAKKTTEKIQQAPQKPAKSTAPVQKPHLKPSLTPPRAQAPKVAAKPQSPFKVAVPKTESPVGKGFSTSNGTANSGGTKGIASSSNSNGASSMPSPQFSTTRVASAGGAGSSRGSSGASGRGSYGTGNMGNPGPGNPNGAPGIDAIKSPQWGPYMRELESKIKLNWHPPKDDSSKRAVLLFKIGKRGDLLSVSVYKSSGSKENDDAAVKAVQLSAPFRALPPEYNNSSVEIEFTFDYNVVGASKH